MKKIAEPSNVVYGLLCRCHPEDGIRYVGKTVKRPHVRLNGHKSSARNHGSSRPIYAWMNKHGIDSIEYRILEIVPADVDLYLREQDWIEKLGTRHGLGNGLNLTDGGAGGLGVTFSEERKANISAARKGQYTEAAFLARRRKLCDDDVAQIKVRLCAGESYRAIADDFEVSSSTIHHICIERDWSHIPWPEGGGRTVSAKSENQSAAMRRRWVDNPPSGHLLQKQRLVHSILAERDIRRIRALRADLGLTARSIAEQFEGVTSVMVSKILRGERWNHIG